MKRLTVLISVVATLMLLSLACGGGGGSAPSADPVSREVTTEGSSLVQAIDEQSAQEGDAYYIPHSRPGPAVDKIEFSSFGVDQAVSELANGKMDLYLFGLKISAARELEGNEGVRAFRSPASSISLFINPAPSERRFNPFSVKEVRQALGNLIDREFIAQDIYGGFAVPMESHVSSLDFDYLTVFEELSENNSGHDFDYAKAQIARAMQDAGAELQGGTWHYDGRPVVIKFIIRTEDERREVGDTIRVALEKVGFQVQPIYKDFAAAIATVYTSDPQSFEWHLYTEGWGRGAPDKYDFAGINSMTAPWMGNMPGGQIVGFWQYENEELDALGKKLFTGGFTSQEERDEIYREMTRLALEDSTRVWLATINSTFPADTRLLGVTHDLVAGPKGILTLREAFIPGEDSLRVGNLWVWTERSVWNPIGGFGDVYSIDIWKNMIDPPIINDPFSGLPIPFRAGFTVETAGPHGKLTVPQGAVLWNAEDDRWDKVPQGTAATSRVVLDYSKYFQSRWHHDEPITMADVMYGIYQAFEHTYDPDKKRIEFVLAATQKPKLDTFKGFRVLDENRLEVYVDFWHFEPDYIASYASITSLPMPWEVLAAMDTLVFPEDGNPRAAYSQSAAARFSVPWLSLVMKKDAGLVDRALRGFERQGFYPENILSGFSDTAQAQARYSASRDWFAQYEHLVISQGPFFLNRYIPSSQYAELLAFRDPGYPFKPGDWYMGRAETVHITDPDISQIVAGEQTDIMVTVEGPGQVGLRYFLSDPARNQIVAEGTGEQLASGEFKISLAPSATRNVTSPILHLHLLAYSDEVVLVEEKIVDLVVR